MGNYCFYVLHGSSRSIMNTFLSQRPRVVTGLILAAVLVACLILGGWPLKILLLAAALVGLYELYCIFWPSRRKIRQKALGLFLGAALILSQGCSPWWTIGCLAASFLIPALGFLFDYGLGEEESRPPVRLEDYGILTLGVMYVPLPLALALDLSRPEQVLVLLAAISSDTFAYYTGTRFGRHKIWPRISPKKSWQGSMGGMAGCILVLVAFGLMGKARGFDLPAFPWWAWAVMGVILNIAAQLGDFFESALKRSAGVKDSGSLLPGHGGVLDRIDSLLFALPVYLLVKFAFLALGLGLAANGGATLPEALNNIGEAL